MSYLNTSTWCFHIQLFMVGGGIGIIHTVTKELLHRLGLDVV